MRQSSARGNRVRFEEIFEPDLKERLKIFLASGTPASYLASALLVFAALGGILFVGTVAPNLFSALGRMYGRSRKIKKEGFYKLRKSFYRLRQEGRIEYVRSERGEDIYRLSEKGKVTLRKFIFNALKIPEPQNWDKKWRMIVFDIPHKKKAARDALRRKLQELNFYGLQRSVWVHPFPCAAELRYVAEVFKIEPYLEIVTIEDFNNPKALEYFRELLSDYS